MKIFLHNTITFGFWVLRGSHLPPEQGSGQLAPARAGWGAKKKDSGDKKTAHTGIRTHKTTKDGEAGAGK